MPPDLSPKSPRLRSILHPTDFSESSQQAFAHALRLAINTGGDLLIVHVGHESPDAETWAHYPAVRATLERWGLLNVGAQPDDIHRQLGIGVEKFFERAGNIIESIVQYSNQWSADLLVIATHGREGIPRWLHASIAEPVARRTKVPTLFVPDGSAGCVSMQDGTVLLDHMLVPVDHQPHPQPAVDAAIRMAHALQAAPKQVTLLHVGQEQGFPSAELPTDMAWKWDRQAREGRTVDEIVRTSEESGSSLVVMATEGHHGFLDALRGSTTEQVLRRSRCPLLAVPANSP